MANNLLIVGDDSGNTEQLARHYRKQDWRVKIMDSLNKAHDALSSHEFEPDVVIVDLQQHPAESSLWNDFSTIQERSNSPEWIFVLNDGIEDFKKEISAISFDLIEKQYDQKRLDVIVTRALRAARLRQRLHQYSSSDQKRYNTASYIGKSQVAREVREILKKLAEVPLSTMIITGETGTGKGLAARIIHNTGLRRNGPMVELNCAALPKELLESELFGHEAGSFTGAKNRHRGLLEQADNGTLFLDEIGDMDLDLQSKLLKAIEDKKIRRLGSEKEVSIDAQIIAATGIDLEQAAKENRFREDLYHRLSVFCLRMPPLRERKEDLIDIMPKLIAEYNAKANKRVEIISDEVWEKMLAYDWPGNVRELRNVIERCVLFSTNNEFPVRWLQLSKSHISRNTDESTLSQTGKLIIPLDGSMSLDEMDRFIIKHALSQNEYNVSETARILGTTRETLRYRIQKYDLKTPG